MNVELLFHNSILERLPATMQYNYDQSTMEFVANPTGEETGNITGNRVFVTGKGAETRFKIEIDDFGHVVGALNRLIQQFIPTFQFPPNPSQTTSVKDDRTFEIKGVQNTLGDHGISVGYFSDTWVEIITNVAKSMYHISPERRNNVKVVLVNAGNQYRPQQKAILVDDKVRLEMGDTDPPPYFVAEFVVTCGEKRFVTGDWKTAIATTVEFWEKCHA